jgi:hypothetical protein
MTFFGATLLSAIATVVLAVFAIVTAGYARRAFIKQSQEIGILLEESERDKAERRMAQAARVFLAADPDAVRLVRPYVKNASDFPVYDARISYTDLDDTADREYLGMIMPSGTRSAAREFSSDLDALDCTSVTFRDAAGVWWTRMPRGELRDESFPAALSGASLAAAFERVTGRRISHRGATRRLPPAEAQSVASPPPAHRPERLVAGKLPVGRRVDGHALSSATMAPARPPDDSIGLTPTPLPSVASAVIENSAARMHWLFGAVGLGHSNSPYSPVSGHAGLSPGRGLPPAPGDRRLLLAPRSQHPPCPAMS